MPTTPRGPVLAGGDGLRVVGELLKYLAEDNTDLPNAELVWVTMIARNVRVKDSVGKRRGWSGGEPAPDPDLDVSDGSPHSPLAIGLGWVARIGYPAAFIAAVLCVFYSLQQGRLDELEAELRPVRARLVATEVKEWIAGNDDWAAFGTFEILSGDEQGRATGNLIPQSFYRSYGLRRQRGRDPLIPREEAEKYLPSWEIGRVYDGYVYPDANEHIFFELPGAAQNALLMRWFAVAAAILLTLGLIASTGVVYLKRSTASCLMLTKEVEVIASRVDSSP